MRVLFIYYRIEARGATRARAAVQALQAQLLERHAGLAAQLMRRDDDEHSEMQTWMEIYSFDGPGGVSPALQAQIEAAAGVLAPLLAGPRHTEAFVPCAS